MSDSVISRSFLDSSEIDEVRRLQKECPEGDRLQLNYHTMSRPGDGDDHFLWLRDGVLVGYAGLSHYCPEEVEVMCMVHPLHRRQGIASNMLARVMDVSRDRGFSRMLLVSEVGSESGQAFVRGSGRLAFTEHLLRSEPSSLRPASSEIVIDELPLGSIAEIEGIMLQSFGEIIEKPTARRFVGRLDGRAVGMMDVDIVDGEAYLSGFAVLPLERGKGYGQQILSAMTYLLRDEGVDTIKIEVETQNRRALDLYLSSGFRPVTSYDYFEILL